MSWSHLGSKYFFFLPLPPNHVLAGKKKCCSHFQGGKFYSKNFSLFVMLNNILFAFLFLVHTFLAVCVILMTSERNASLEN